MKITAIKAQVRNPDRVSIFVDGKYAVSLTLDQLLEQRLQKGDELEEPDIQRLKKLSDEGKLKARVLEWLMLRPHSVKELRDYMYRKKIDKDLIDAWVTELRDKNYVNDEQFARWFAEQRIRKNKSARIIAAELGAKGVQRDVVLSVLADISPDDTEALRALVAKLRARPRYQDDQKLKEHLVRKGFSYSDVAAAIAHYQEGTGD